MLRVLTVAPLATLLALLAACSTSSSREAVGGGGREIHNVVRCSIYDMGNRLLRTFPGQYCQFLPDGRVASWSFREKGKAGFLSMRGPTGRLLWQRVVAVHHQLNLDASGTRLLALAAGWEMIGERLLRGDSAQVYDLDGNLVSRFSFVDHRKELERFMTPEVLEASRLLEKPLCMPGFQDFSHGNSIYEIPENEYAKVNPAFARGNFIINSIRLPIVFIVDRQMKKVLWGRSLASLDAERTHDVQVLPNGHLLFYRNSKVFLNEFRGFSSLVEFDLESNSAVWTYEADPPMAFFAPSRGGVQSLANGNVLYNNPPFGLGQEITRSGRAVWSWAPLSEFGLPTQQIKRYDLSAFLENNRDVSSIPRTLAREADRDGKEYLMAVFRDGSLPFHKGGLPVVLSANDKSRPLQYRGLKVLVDGVSAPIAMVSSDFVVVELPKGWENKEHRITVFSSNDQLARIASPIAQVYPDRYVAEFVRLDQEMPHRPGALAR